MLSSRFKKHLLPVLCSLTVSGFHLIFYFLFSSFQKHIKVNFEFEMAACLLALLGLDFSLSAFEYVSISYILSWCLYSCASKFKPLSQSLAGAAQLLLQEGGTDAFAFASAAYAVCTAQLAVLSSR